MEVINPAIAVNGMIVKILLYGLKCCCLHVY
ncbi:hypothetical protein Dtox_0592 [Desulfofarcimen acetoxidans DSM 771]|uniref:Uncharacterized protein n=1 Tax=Desulfofarcimen acetoxidans (strain ATCC 49208 / DSM 771 / KCTC 5769 / VKM B-1644 / 5575) TaxID=485916 RepID=C8W657_DESAS|nr:hypothetical protein Dtox_0592 [Desulfofarcimen acetoxidans DSM 771]